MNSTRYIFARLASSFGLHLKNKRLSEAADEAHLLRQAEEILGEEIWEKTEDIEAINVEYWNLRKHQLAMNKLEGQIEGANEVLEASHEQRNTILQDTSHASNPLEKTRDELLEKSEKLISERDSILSQAKQLKRHFEASTTKVTVLTSQEEQEPGSVDQELIKKEREKLTAFKKNFIELKKEREKLGIEITAMDQRINDIEEELNQDLKRHRDKAASAYQNIGEATRKQSKLRAEVGVNEQEMSLYFSEIGCYVSKQVGHDALCTEICKDHAGLISQIQSLRNSIELNHRLAAKAGS